jgi:hypothetical protein
VEYKATSHFDSPPNKPLRACVSKGCTLLPGFRPFSVHGHDRKFGSVVLQTFALFRTSPHFQFVSFHEDTTLPPRCNEPEYSADPCSLVKNIFRPSDRVICQWGSWDSTSDHLHLHLPIPVPYHPCAPYPPPSVPRIRSSPPHCHLRGHLTFFHVLTAVEVIIDSHPSKQQSYH